MRRPPKPSSLLVYRVGPYVNASARSILSLQSVVRFSRADRQDGSGRQVGLSIGGFTVILTGY